MSGNQAWISSGMVSVSGSASSGSEVNTSWEPSTVTPNAPAVSSTSVMCSQWATVSAKSSHGWAVA